MSSQAVINQLPVMGLPTNFYVTVIGNDNSLQLVDTITNAYTLYGNAIVNISGYFIPQDKQPIAIAIYSTLAGISYFNILYTKAIYPQSLPNNFVSIIQKLPFGIFEDTSSNSLVGAIFKAKSQMLNDYYKQYFYTQNQVFAYNYSANLEYEYNQTVGLLQNSLDVESLFNLLSSTNIVALNSYDLELFVSKYIYYRLGYSSAVYIDDHVDPQGAYWYLEVQGSSELGADDLSSGTTILAPDNLTPVILNLRWTIFNANAMTDNFKKELIKLIIRISRTDIGNEVTFNNHVTPQTSDNFNYIGATYPNDPRLLYGKCLAFIGNNQFPLNIIGYQKQFS